MGRQPPYLIHGIHEGLFPFPCGAYRAAETTRIFSEHMAKKNRTASMPRSEIPKNVGNPFHSGAVRIVWDVPFTESAPLRAGKPPLSPSLNSH